MRIKRVVIQGFKTFAKRTEFVFDPGITAIVGPNGSGKSNVVDAVRWCLGEQSFSLLRSKKTSDVIFSGSDKRARLSMAQVSLTLDNSQQELPIDFEEVEITRRAYRDGANDYLINGQQVRLLDVTELLAQTGLGKRTYAVVGQGLIDKVLSLSPEERRSLFEEAAGITGYQAKRTKTLRQLEATEQNLTRAQDIIAELSPRLNYLRRQAERAQERQQIAEDLRDMLRQWYGYRWHTTLGNLAARQNQEKTLRLDVATRQQTLVQVGAKIEGTRKEQMELRGALGELHAQSSQHHSQAESVGRELAVSQERLRQVQARVEETQRELAPLRLQGETLAERLLELATTLAAAQAAFQERQQAVDALQFEVGQRQAERKQLQDALDGARHHLSQLQSRQADRESRLSQLAERRSALRLEQEAQSAARAKAEAEATAVAQELESAQSVIALEENQAVELQAEIGRLEATAVELRNQLKQAEAGRQSADRLVDQLQTRYDLLTRLRNEGAGYASGVRAVLQAGAAKTGERLQGILGTVATLVQVPPHLDQAIETALGGAFQNLITERWDDAREAIELLKRTGQGRATFLPLDRLSVLPAIEAPRGAGILGNAADLVTYEPHLADVVLSLLGRTWVAEDLNAARAALDKLGNGPRPTVVTLGGEIVRPGGAVTGGRDGNRRDESVLAREREYRELPQQIERAKAQSTRATAACNELTTQIEKGALLMEQSRQMLAELARQERQRREQAAETQRRLDRAQQAARWQVERLEQSSAELARLDDQEQAYKEALAQIREERSGAESNLAAAEASIEAAGASELLQQLADLRAAAAEAQGHLRSQQALRENQLRSQQSTSDQIRNKEQRLQELASEADRLGRRIGELSAQEAELSKQLAFFQEKIEPAEAQLSQLEATQREEEANEREQQQALRANETAWNNAQLQLQRTEDLLTQLRYDIEHDFGLVELEQGADMAYQPPLPLESVVEHLPVIESVPDGLEEEVKEMRARLSRVSNVNPDAPREYSEAAERYEFLSSESKDLQQAAADLRRVIKELDELMEVELRNMFKAVAEQFEHFFSLLFNGGTAKLILTTPEDINNTGVEIIARPPGKRPQSLALLSGGERALSACALIFSILQVSPTPFCVLDEVDAALDEANVDRFRQTVETLTGATQFIIVTHNRRTLEGANTIYGVTMGDDGISKTISLRLEGDKIVQSDGSENPDDVKVVEELIQM